MRRLTWLAAGFGLGITVAYRVTAGGTQPALVGAAHGVATRVRRGLGDAIAEGRAEMAQQEVRFREAFGTDVLHDPTGRGTDHSKR
jgi:hypothetical protein